MDIQGGLKKFEHARCDNPENSSYSALGTKQESQTP